MSDASCADCGRPLPANAPAGFCPSCVLQLAQGDSVAPVESPEDDGSNPRSDSLRHNETAGAQIGRYKLLEIIGEGGFGTVWMAEQTEPVRRKVALKIIKLGMDTRQVVARFEAERQALAIMDHPNMARVLDAGATDAGRPYFVMELVRGISITEFCDVRQLNTRERIELLIPVCQAVQHAHQKGIIHRDLKPSNVLVTEQDGRPLPKIIDFGVAKAIEEPLTDKTLFTRFHQFLGTPAYMSPEQAGLGGLDVDARSDIYSLGVLLYELLTGQPPLDPRQLREVSHEAVLKTIREVEPAKPSTRLSTLNREDLATVAGRRGEDPQRLPRLVRGDLDWIVLKALDKDRTRRYASANGLAADLTRYLENEPIAARPPSPLYRLERAWRRNRLVYSALTVVVAALCIGFGISSWMLVRESRANQQARIAGQSLRQNLYVSEMNAAYHAWESGRVGRARDLLDRQRPVAGSASPDLRGFDWRYLWSVTRPKELFTLTNATDWGFALSGDGRTLVGLVATSGDPSVDWRLQFWNLAERRQVAMFRTNTSWIFNGAFAPDGRTFALPRTWLPWTNHAVQIWDAEARQLMRELPIGRPALGIAFSPDGRFLAASGGDDMYVADTPGELRLWDAATGALLRPPLRLPQWAYQVAFSHDSRHLAVSCGDGVARVVEVPTGNIRAELTGHNGFVAAVAFTHGGTRVVTGDERGYMRIWDWPRGYLENTFKAHDAPIYQIDITADDQRIVTASRDFTARMWDRNTGDELARFAGHNGGVNSVRLLPGDETLVTASQDHNVKVWNARPSSSPNVLSRHHQRADPRFASGGRYVAAVDYDAHQITFFETATGRVRTNLVGQELAVSADGKQLAVLLETNLLFLDPVKLSEITRVACASQLGGQPSFSPDGKWLACRSEAPRNSPALTRVTVVDVLQRRVVREIETDGEGRDGWAPVFFARGGRLLLTLRWGAQRTVVWDTSTWRQVTTFEGPPADGTVAAVSPDGMTFAMAGYGGKLHLWDLDRLEPREPVELGAGDIFSLAFDAEGRTLAAGVTDGTIRLWNVPARQEVAVLRGHSSLVRSLEFSPDGRALASGSRDLSIRLWRAPSLEEINAAEGGASARP